MPGAQGLFAQCPSLSHGFSMLLQAAALHPRLINEWAAALAEKEVESSLKADVSGEGVNPCNLELRRSHR